MDLDVGLQRAFDRVELVSGSIGDPGEGRMCLMSLVAFLAGEAHSDAPGCASPLIQTFAVLVNDHMPHAARQRLKPFAPRIIGTNDGFDPVRAEILRGGLGRRDPRQGAWPMPHGARTRCRKALAPSAPLAVAPQGRTRPSARPFRRRRRRSQPGGGRRGWSHGRRAALRVPASRNGTGTRPSGCSTGCAMWARRPGAGRAYGPSAWRGSRTCPRRASARTRARGRRSPRRTSSFETHPAKLGGSGAIEEGPWFPARGQRRGMALRGGVVVRLHDAPTTPARADGGRRSARQRRRRISKGVSGTRGLL